MEGENSKLLYKILDKLDDINQSLGDIDQRLILLERDIEYIKNSNSNMDKHISFVENVYDTIKNPLYYIINKIKPIENIPVKQIGD